MDTKEKYQSEEREHGKKHKDPRNVFMFGRLEDDVSLPVVKRLLKVDQDFPNEPINLYINSSGGNGYNADAVIATMQSLNSKSKYYLSWTCFVWCL